MGYSSLLACVKDLENRGDLVRIQEEVDPNLEMAHIHRRVVTANGPALFFEKVQGSPFPAVSNLFGKPQRWQYIFRQELPILKQAMELVSDPIFFLKDAVKTRQFAKLFALAKMGFSALPKRTPLQKAAVFAHKTNVSQLPQLVSWPKDGGPFITLPQVFTLDPLSPSLLKSNLGMYRVQLAGNNYIPNQEVGLHYQIHRGIGIHHQRALKAGKDLFVSIFVGGPPAHSLAAVMPLPEGLSELLFAGMLAGRRFHYSQFGEHILSSDADFCLIGRVSGNQTKLEGPFGDHLGYYSLAHYFPFLKIQACFHRKKAIWPFTVVGRPPQEDSQFGQMIHEITKAMIPKSLPGIKALHAVDESGVHPLLLALGSERYVPFAEKKPLELLTQANAILGFGQCSLAKYLFIGAHDDEPDLNIHDVSAFFSYFLRRANMRQDLHYHTKTSMDTLDYSGCGLNKGSKLVIASCGEPIRDLATSLPTGFVLPKPFSEPKVIQEGILAIQAGAFQNYDSAKKEIAALISQLERYELKELPLIVIVDDSDFTARSFANFLWVCFTRSNPSHDTYGTFASFDHYHFGCTSLLIDARIKLHHAPVLAEDLHIKAKADRFFQKSGPLGFLDA